MKKKLTLFSLSLIVFWSAKAQTITISDGAPASACFVSEVLNFSGTNTFSGTTRNKYTKEGILGPGADGASIVDVLWVNTPSPRWEIQIEYTTVFYNTSTSAPNPPGLGTGTWVNTGIACNTSLTVFTYTPLPVELVQFGARTTERGKTRLTWTTATETQNKGFDIERSADGARFEKIGFVAGKGASTTPQSYTFEDGAPYKGVSYYRLKQLDADGRFEYSNIVAATQRGHEAAYIAPNPSKGVFNISGIENIEDEQFTLINSIGQILPVTVQPDGQLDLSAFPSGVYHLRAASSGSVFRLLKAPIQ